MAECSEIFFGMDVSKDRHAVADGGRDGAVRFFGEIGSDGGAVRRFVAAAAAAGAGPRLIDARIDPSGYLQQMRALRG